MPTLSHTSPGSFCTQYSTLPSVEPAEVVCTCVLTVCTLLCNEHHIPYTRTCTCIYMYLEGLGHFVMEFAGFHLGGGGRGHLPPLDPKCPPWDLKNIYYQSHRPPHIPKTLLCPPLPECLKCEVSQRNLPSLHIACMYRYMKQ